MLIVQKVAIHNKNGQGLLQKESLARISDLLEVAIHNKNGQGLLQRFVREYCK